MEPIIDTIRSAVAPDATAEARAAGVQACEAILAALRAKAGDTYPVARPIEVGPAAAAVAALVRSAPPDQLLDLAIAKLRAMVPTDAQPAIRPMHIPLVRLPAP